VSTVSQASAFPKAVLFDLDGTLLDSAPDMFAAANAMRAARGMPPMLLAELRPHVSKGARAMVQAAFPDHDSAEREGWIPEFLDCYQRELGRHCGVFEGIEAMLASLEAAGTRWGIVTNKPEYLAAPLVPMLGWQDRCAVLIGGDTLAARKPDPLPLLVAAERIGVDPWQCIYVGDDERDILAARAAGMPSVVALWGYRLSEDDPFAWQADVLIERPRDLCDAMAWPRCHA
jgi:2-phosphoglycolate phosphatase